MNRRRLHIRDWPAQDKAAWDALFAQGGLLKHGGAFAHLRPATIWLREQSYGNWLAFCRASGVDLSSTEPVQRVTDALVTAWAKSMSDLSWTTRHIRLVGLRITVTGFAPDEPQALLHDLCREAEWHGNRQVPERKIGRILPTGDLLRAGMDYLREVTGETFVDATRFRDGLMVASLALLSLRIGNFRDLELGRSFQTRTGGYDILLDGTETKNHRALDKELPEQLVPLMECYLKTYRPILLAKSKSPHQFLWVNDWGNRYSHSNLGARISRLTDKMLGTAVSPHLFRDSVATTIARVAPSQSHAMVGALGHASLRTADKYYNQAKCLDASRAYTPFIEELVEEASRAHSGRRRNARKRK